MKEKKKAAALRYEQSYESPMVTAAGILDRAKESNVPVVYDKELADLLVNVDVGDYIPVALYDAVAKVIAYVIDVDKNVGRR